MRKEKVPLFFPFLPFFFPLFFSLLTWGKRGGFYRDEQAVPPLFTLFFSPFRFPLASSFPPPFSPFFSSFSRIGNHRKGEERDVARSRRFSPSPFPESQNPKRDQETLARSESTLTPFFLPFFFSLSPFSCYQTRGAGRAGQWFAPMLPDYSPFFFFFPGLCSSRSLQKGWRSPATIAITVIDASSYLSFLFFPFFS